MYSARNGSPVVSLLLYYASTGPVDRNQPHRPTIWLANGPVSCPADGSLSFRGRRRNATLPPDRITSLVSYIR